MKSGKKQTKKDINIGSVDLRAWNPSGEGMVSIDWMVFMRCIGNKSYVSKSYTLPPNIRRDNLIGRFVIKELHTSSKNRITTFSLSVFLFCGDGIKQQHGSHGICFEHQIGADHFQLPDLIFNIGISEGELTKNTVLSDPHTF